MNTKYTIWLNNEIFPYHFLASLQEISALCFYNCISLEKTLLNYKGKAPV